MSVLIRDQRGISAIVSLALVTALIMMGLGVYLTQQLPVDWKNEEIKTMKEAKESFVKLRDEIYALKHGGSAVVELKLGTPAPTALLSALTPAEIDVTTARNFEDATEARTDNNAFSSGDDRRWRAYGTYVKEDEEEDNLMGKWCMNEASWAGAIGEVIDNSGIGRITPDSSTVGLWYMDEAIWNGTPGEVVDSSGQGNNGTAAGGLSTIGNGKIGRAGNFDGGNDYINIPNSDELVFGTSNFTIEAWIYPTAWGGDDGWNAIITKHNGDPGSWLFRVANNADSGNVAKLNFENGEGGRYFANTIVALNEWHHAAITRFGNTFTFYLDGKEDGSFTDTTNFTSTYAIRISGQGNVTGERFTGGIDEVAIYKRSFTAGEMARHARLNNGQAHREANTVADGKLERGGYFGGVHDNVTVPSSPGLNITGSFTIMAWINPEDGSADFIQEVVNKEEEAVGGYYMWRDRDTHKVWTGFNAGEVEVRSVTPVMAGSWYHLAGVWDGSGMRIYINGVLDNSIAGGAANPAANNENLMIGGYWDGGPFKGTMDEVSVWNRALTGTEVARYAAFYDGWNYLADDYENDHLVVSTTQGQRIRSYLKFDLSDLHLYNSGDYTFYDDVVIDKAQLMLYTVDFDLKEEPDNVFEIRPPIVVEAWGVENDSWCESMTWNTQPHNEGFDKLLENNDVSGETAWITWDVTNFVKDEFEKVRKYGKWYQTMWDYETETLETGKFASYDRYSSKGDSIIIANDGQTITGGNGTDSLTSSIFDAGDDSMFWNYVSFWYTDNMPLVEIRFDNHADMAYATPWITVTKSGYAENVYARYAQYRITPIASGTTAFESITIEYTDFVSFVLREPQAWAPSTIQNRVAFNSRDNSRASVAGVSPVLRVTYTRRERAGYVEEGRIDFGSIKYSTNNKYLPNTNYVYEGGLLYLTQGDSGWYAVTLEEPTNLVTITTVEGSSNIYMTVTRYQISASFLMGESAGGTGHTAIRMQEDETEYVVSPPSNPNRSQVTIVVNSDQLSLWRDYLRKRAAQINSQLGGEYSYYGPYAMIDYDSGALTIYGKDLSPNAQDIYYTEQVIWIDTSVGLYQGGRT